MRVPRLYHAVVQRRIGVTVAVGLKSGACQDVHEAHSFSWLRYPTWGEEAYPVLDLELRGRDRDQRDPKVRHLPP